eukprot:XP_001689884.1 phosphoglucomutase [Chlamydomonas reinhardtii]
MGPGTARMNAVVVQQTAQGLCVYLEAVAAEQLAAGGIVVGYDGRHGSKEFAALTGAVFASRGHRVALFRRVVPTPFVAAGVAELGAAAGVMVTASHNPKEYNGYKVYWGNGCQIIPPHDAGIAAAIEANLDLWNLEPLLAGDGPYEDDVSTAGLLACPQLSDPWERVSAAYYARLEALGYLPAAEAAETAEAASRRGGASDSGGAGGLSRAAALGALGTPVYTPLHGVGAEPLLQAFRTFSLPEPYIVPSQRLPDPDFPTVVFPNPEEGAGTWAAAFAAASERGARLVLANDPDADRLAVAERSPSGQFRPFTGNEIGALLAHWVWTNFRKRHPEVAPSRCVMLASAVSSKLLGAMAEKEGFVFVETLTGFKWLGNTAMRLEREQGMTVLFAFEEAIGFMLGGMYKDKDGISAASVFAELAAHTYGSGRTLDELLRGLYDRYGFFDYRSGYFITDAAKSRAVFNDLRGGGGFEGRTAVYAKDVAGVGVTSVRDLGTGLDTAQPDGRAVLPWQSGDMMITYGLEGAATLTLRASGTEPKLKYYLEVKGSDAAAAAALADRLVGGLAEELVGLSRHGLKRPATPH